MSSGNREEMRFARILAHRPFTPCYFHNEAYVTGGESNQLRLQWKLQSSGEFDSPFCCPDRHPHLTRRVVMASDARTTNTGHPELFIGSEESDQRTISRQ